MKRGIKTDNQKEKLEKLYSALLELRMKTEQLRRQLAQLIKENDNAR